MPLPLIKYPFQPEGKEYLYVEPDNEFILLAKAEAEVGGCRKHATGAVFVKDNSVLTSGGNAGTFVSVCPRAYKEYPTGQGYQFCKNYCHQEGHAEVVAIQKAKKENISLQGSDLYLYGHWWICENCWNHLIEAGVRNCYLAKGSKKDFNYEYQKESTITPTPSFSLYVSGPLTRLKNPEVKNMYEAIGQLAESKGFSTHVPHLYTDPVKHAQVNPEEVYAIDSAQVKKADLMICYVGEPSIGTGMEIEMANQSKTLVILVSEKEQPVSRLALGSPNIIDYITFIDKEDLLKQLDEKLKQFIKVGSQQNVSVQL